MTLMRPTTLAEAHAQIAALDAALRLTLAREQALETDLRYVEAHRDCLLLQRQSGRIARAA